MSSADRSAGAALLSQAGGIASTLAAEGRQQARAGEWAHAMQSFVQAFEADPAQWWLAVEALRAGLRVAREVEPSTVSRVAGTRTTLLFYPDFSVNNRYQPNLYSRAREQGVEVVPLSGLAIDAHLCGWLAGGNVTFHQHWLHPVYRPYGHDEPAAQRAVTRHLSLLRALKAFNCRVLWTLHNLVDHDADEVQQRLSARAARGMQSVADTVLVHDEAAMVALAAFTGGLKAGQCRVVPHPLYDDILAMPRQWPAELDQPCDGRRWLVMVGRLSPYKGGHELLAALERVALGPVAERLHVVIAGRVPDPSLIAVARRLQSSRPGLLSVLPRRLEEDELAALVEQAAVVVTPYRQVLTSGTYFLAATFARPVLAPRTGMFEACVAHGVDGLLYDGTVEGLAQGLEAVARCPADALEAMGERARARTAGQTIGAVARRFLTEVLGPA